MSSEFLGVSYSEVDNLLLLHTSDIVVDQTTRLWSGNLVATMFQKWSQVTLAARTRQCHVLDVQGCQAVGTHKIHPGQTGACLTVAFGQGSCRDSIPHTWRPLLHCWLTSEQLIWYNFQCYITILNICVFSNYAPILFCFRDITPQRLTRPKWARTGPILAQCRTAGPAFLAVWVVCVTHSVHLPFVWCRWWNLANNFKQQWDSIHNLTHIRRIRGEGGEPRQIYSRNFYDNK